MHSCRPALHGFLRELSLALQLNTDLVYLIVTLAQNHILTAAQWYHEFLLLRLMCLFDLWDACSSFFSNRMQGLLQ